MISASVEAGGSQTTSGRGRLEARKISISRLAEDLGRHLHRPVVDMTGLKGVFDLNLEWVPDESQTMPNRQMGEQDTSVRLGRQEIGYAVARKP